MKTSIVKILVLCAPLALVSCGTKKALVTDGTTSATSHVAEKKTDGQQVAFMQKVNDQKVYAKNIVGNLTFTANLDGKSVSLSGSLHMRRDKVIRLQLFIPYLGTEVGRLEFTPDYVMVVDRIHKQCVKGDYNQLAFLRSHGLSFYSLQALFWNPLMLP